jgi:hypothetical protein
VGVGVGVHVRVGDDRWGSDPATFPSLAVLHALSLSRAREALTESHAGADDATAPQRSA